MLNLRLTVTVPFGVGVQTTVGTTTRNIFEIDVTPTTIAVHYLDPTNTIGFVNGENAIIKMTTTQSSLINLVSLESETGITLSPGAFLFGSNFFQVDLAQASFISPGATLDGADPQQSGFGARERLDRKPARPSEAGDRGRAVAARLARF